MSNELSESMNNVASSEEELIAAVRADYAHSFVSASVPSEIQEPHIDGGIHNTSASKERSNDHHPAPVAEQVEPAIESSNLVTEVLQSVLGSKSTPMTMEAKSAEQLRTPSNFSAAVSSDTNGTSDNKENNEDVIEAPSGPHRGSEHHELIKRPPTDIIEAPDARKRSRGSGRRSGVASVTNQSQPQAV
jgi:hypothetical protein